MALRGTVKKWFSDKGFGFIDTPDHQDDVFVHFSQIEGSRTTLNLGENVTFCMGMNSQTGKVVAEKVIGDLTGIPAPGPGYPGGAGMGMMGAFGRGRGIPQCFEFQKDGNCKFGDTCKFSHGEAGPPAYAIRGGGIAGFGGGYGQPVALQRFSPYGQPGVAAYGGLAAQAGAYGGYGLPQQPGLVYGTAPTVGGYGGVAPTAGLTAGNLGVAGYIQPQTVPGYPQPQTAVGYPQTTAASYGTAGQPGVVYSQQPGMSNGYMMQAGTAGVYGQAGATGATTQPQAEAGYAQQPQLQPQT